MLQLLTFLVEKLSLLWSLQLFVSSWSDGGGDGDGVGEEPQRAARHHAAPSAPPRRGDLLEVPRTIFTHFGIYLGDNRVAHLIPDILPALTDDHRRISTVITNRRLVLGCVARCATVRADTLEDFAYGCGVLVNRVDAAVKAPPLPNEEVARRAEGLLGETPYSLLWNNCEHFVTHCRYGHASSRQTEQFCQRVKSIIRDRRSVMATGLLGLISMLCFGMAPSTALPTILIPFTLWMAG